MSIKDDPKPRRLIESFYEHSTGKTFVRHPFYDDEWVENTIFTEAVKGLPAPSSGGMEACEILVMIPHDKQTDKPKSRHIRLKLTSAGSCHVVSGM